MEKFKFTDTEGKEIVAFKWTPKGENIKAVIQIAHGMTERSLRYDYFARKMNEEGYIVYANDHRGHGETAGSKEELGYIADEDGFNWMVKDLKELTDIIKVENPSIPVVLLGHSMGSFLSQRYAELYGDEIDYLILSGTNGKPKKITKLGAVIANREIKKYGRRHISKRMDKLSFGDFNKEFAPARTNFDWLCSVEEEVNKYMNDELCGFVCSSSFYYDLINGLWAIHKKENLARIPKKLPMYIFAGDRDPVGYSGKGIVNLYDCYRELQIEDVSFKLYKDGRHEMLNEHNKDEVIKDILLWLEDRIGKTEKFVE
ncbi:alpha/beta hydrolase [Clostridium paraputrificum]|uniref:alpha/beta hydrolase n=1 Tax=Clostridium TaxID=1485 RepID=UPI003D33308E